MEEHEPGAWPDSWSPPSSWERPKAELMNKAKRQRLRMKADLPTSPFPQTQPSSRSGIMSKLPPSSAQKVEHRIGQAWSSSMIDPAAARHGEALSSRGQRRTHEQAELGDITCIENTPSLAPSFYGQVPQEAELSSLPSKRRAQEADPLPPSNTRARSCGSCSLLATCMKSGFLDQPSTTAASEMEEIKADHEDTELPLPAMHEG
ncbi:hypothetical protein Dimus_016237 [Dionaea muscipula]